MQAEHNPFTPKSAKLKNKQHHLKVLLNIFHWNDLQHTRVSSTDSRGTTTFIDSSLFDSGSEGFTIYNLQFAISVVNRVSL